VLTKPVNHIVLKCFETASLGGIQITNYSSELEFWFSDEKEAVYYNSENLREKFNKYLYLLTDQDIRTLQSNARFKEKEFHSYRARFENYSKTIVYKD
jgi:spore maturation protein CgeB